MTTIEFTALCEQLGMSDEELARELDVTPHLIQKWKSGRVAIAERFALALQSLAYRKRADALLATSGLSPCRVVEAWQTRAGRSETTSTDDLLNLQRHIRSCTTCQARERYVREHLGPAPAPEPPRSVTGRIYIWTAARIGLLPEWARPAAGGAIVLFAIVAARVAFALPAVILSGGITGKWLSGVLVPFVAALGGAAGGFGYSFLGKPLRPIRVAGPYLAGVVTVAAYMTALAIIFSVMGAPMVTSESDLVIFAVVTIFFGLVLGRSWFKPDDAGARRHAASTAIGA